MAEVFDYLAKDYLKRKDPIRSETKNEGKIKTVSEAEIKIEALVKPARKGIPISVKRIVWTRDQGQCQHFIRSTGKKCGSPYLLEIDHIKRVRHGGDNDPNNLRLLCHSHNHLRG